MHLKLLQKISKAIRDLSGNKLADLQMSQEFYHRTVQETVENES